MTESKKHCKELWRNAQSFNDLCNAMVVSIKNRCETPWHLGGTDDETEEIIPSLINIANTGNMFTIEGQPGICERYDTSPNFGQQQRAYTAGFIRKTIIEKFINNLPKDIFVCIYNFKTGGKIIKNFPPSTLDFYNMDEIPDLVIKLTVEYHTNNSNDMSKWTLYNNYTNFTIGDIEEFASNDLELLTDSLKNKKNEKLLDEMCFIFLVQHDMCKTGINEKILKALRN